MASGDHVFKGNRGKQKDS